MQFDMRVLKTLPVSILPQEKPNITNMDIFETRVHLPDFPSEENTNPEIATSHPKAPTLPRGDTEVPTHPKPRPLSHRLAL